MLRRLLLALIAAGLTAAAAWADPVYPPGHRIGLEPPAGMSPAMQFSGFEDTAREAKIGMLDLPPGAYENIESSAFAAEQPGMTDVKRELFAFGSGIGFLFTGRGQQNGVTVHKWFLLARAVHEPVMNLTALVSVEVPEAALAVYTDAVVRKALASVTFRATPIEEQLSLMPFKLNDFAGFRVVEALPTGGVVLTEGPSQDINRQPYVIVSVGSGGPAEPADRGRFARDLLSQAPLRDFAVRSAEAMRIGGLPGHEIRATARNIAGEPITLVQWVRFGGGGFLRVVAVTREDTWDAMFPRFRAVRDGIEPK